MKKIVLSGIVAALLAPNLHAEAFDLGKVTVTSELDENIVFEQTTTEESIERDNALSVSEALDNVSGITQEIQGGRAESTLYIRGFDARRIGVFIDGVPVYVPYDGNFDYDRFLTTDIAEIDVSKGYSPVAYGANTMGGVINIISKKPTKALEGSLKSHVVFDSNVNFARQVSALNVGTLQDKYYIQLGANYANQDHFRLSDDFEPTAYQPSGDRLRSETQDQKINLKAGYLIDETAEVALGYINQQGEKQQPPATDTDFSKEKYWDWPYWDKETIYLNGQKIFDDSYLKAVLYYDKFKNSLYSYADDTYSTFNNKGFTFKSKYDDYSYGARLSYGTEIGKHMLTLSANYKTDVHRGYDISKTDSTTTLTEKYEDNTLSLGIEDVYKISEKMELLAGISYDRKEGEYAYDEDSAIEGIPLGSQDTFNPQIALLYKPDGSTIFRASIARKTYLTSMKDRYSRRLGSAIPNPDLKSEKSTHYELSYHKKMQNTDIGITGFIASVDDAIQSVVVDDNGTTDTRDDLSQNQNIGEFEHRGIELDINYQNDDFKVGGNYTYLSLVNKSNNGAKLTDVPKHQLFAYAQKDLTSNLSLYGNIKMRKGAYEQKMDRTYVINPTFTTLDAKVIYRPSKDLTAELGVKNLTDKYYAYDSAFPMPGREFFVTMQYKF
ncbi:TonB-dependent receptor plug domain-containing protein [Sulfurovum mangrovi]|uniref:TonB-dependent receptor plug domain-containing protein n=1 Tax=Sulfurovum mangrovi TaxID=2893889 RepID=UPI001E5DDE0A|nr:TonB-dependent receptor [Sulfurovum mangrovi]UFH58029.1 TonB-dependent receptor [Sulfurovum mangrovi]